MTAGGPEVVHEPQEQYDGPASLVLTAENGPVESGPVESGPVESRPVEVEVVEVRLRGHFEPIDGRFHWYGRIAAQPALEAIRLGSTVTLRTPYGTAEARLSDLDPWGRPRLAGTGRPPF